MAVVLCLTIRQVAAPHCGRVFLCLAVLVLNNTNNKISIVPKLGAKTCNQRRSVAYAT